ncbi:mitochondrial import receptor subunit TOM5 homolog [Branchiostoma floridae x Branchiostoma japonicum]
MIRLQPAGPGGAVTGGLKVDPQEQKKALRQEVWANVKVFVVIVAALRAAPYILDKMGFMES